MDTIGEMVRTPLCRSEILFQSVKYSQKDRFDSHGLNRGLKEEKENSMRLPVELTGIQLVTRRETDSSL